LGDEVAVEIDGKVLVGRVAEIAGAVDTGTRRRTIRLDLPPSAQPPVGTFARLSLPGPKRSRLLVPERAVVARGGLELAWVAPPGGAVSLRYVRTGAREEGGLVEVRSGLEAGERVVLDPPADLEAGTRVAK
jgi:multidrug efflux pump subunit AcrA (membrane-fusion protein)